MSCNQLSAITYSCLSNTGGLKAIYIALHSNVTGQTFNGIGTVESVSLMPNTYFEAFQFNRDTCSLEEDAMINIQNGTTYFQQTVNLVIPRREAAKRAKLQVLAAGQPLLDVIVEDQNGLFWYIGLTNGAYLTANKAGSGVKKGDANDYKITIIGEEPDSAPEVDSSIISTITSTV